MRAFHLLFLLAVLQCPATTLVYNAQFTTPITDFGTGFVRSFFQVDGPTPTLSGTLNPGDQFQLVYSAPSGYLFRIFPPPASASTPGFFASLLSAQVTQQTFEAKDLKDLLSGVARLHRSAIVYDKDTPMTKFNLSLLTNFGVKAESIVDSNGEFKGLSELV